LSRDLGPSWRISDLLGGGDADRVAIGFAHDAERLIDAERDYDPDNVFRSAIALPVSEGDGRHN
jgi:hypothetical protein